MRARVFVGPDRSAKVSVLDQLMQREAGEREISLPPGGCEHAAEALALVVAVMIEAGRGSFPAEPEEPPPERPLPTPPPRREPEPEPEQPRRVRPERHAWLGAPPGHDLSAAAGVGHGIVPGWGLALTVGWGVRWSSVWPIWLHATTGPSEPGSDARTRIGVAYATLSICPLQLEKARFRGQICPGISGGGMWSERRQVVASTPIALAGVAVGVHLRVVGRLELIALARVEAPLVHLEFVYRRRDGSIPQLHETKAVATSFFGGVGLRFRR